MGADPIWIPPTARPATGTHRCHVCKAEGVPPQHIARCYRNVEHEVRSSRINPVLAHPDPELEAFMRHNGGLNRPKGERKRAA